MKKLAPILIAAIIAAFIIAQILLPKRQEYLFYPMGGIPFRIIAYERSKLEFREDIKAAKVRIAELVNLYNAHDPLSVLSNINSNAYNEDIPLNENMLHTFNEAINWWRISDGAFDITVGPLIDLWKEAGENNVLPNNFAIDEALSRIGIDKISISENKIRFKSEGLKIDLGGIAEGDIIDQVVKLLKERGVKRGIVDGGGDILAFGEGKFTFGIQDPEKNEGEIIGTVKIPDGAIVTSGNYARFVEVEGKKYSHIIDPKTGWPVDNKLISATVTGPTCIGTDAAATSLMVMGREKATEFIEKNPNFNGIFIEKDDDYIIWIPEELVSSVQLNEPWSHKVRTF